jgi:hypothetical protein
VAELRTQLVALFDTLFGRPVACASIFTASQMQLLHDLQRAINLDDAVVAGILSRMQSRPTQGEAEKKEE